jgi:hypothetical protein
LAGSCEHGNEPSGSVKCGEFLRRWTTGGFSRRTRLPRVDQSVRGREHEPVNSKDFIPHIGLNFSFVTDEEMNVFVELCVYACLYIPALLT